MALGLGALLALMAASMAASGIKKGIDTAIENKNASDRANRFLNLNNDFDNLFHSNASVDSLLKFAMDNPDWTQANKGVIESYINRASQREFDSRNLYSENLAKMKEAGINPLVGLGNVGSLGSYENVGGLDLDASVDQASVASSNSNNVLNDLKNVLLVWLALGRLDKLGASKG